jgi:hypothetical protein
MTAHSSHIDHEREAGSPWGISYDSSKVIDTDEKPNFCLRMVD